MLVLTSLAYCEIDLYIHTSFNITSIPLQLSNIIHLHLPHHFGTVIMIQTMINF